MMIEAARYHLVRAVFLCLLLAGCSSPDAGTARIVVLGDSVMAWNGRAGTSVGDALSRALGEPVDIRAVSGASLLPRGSFLLAGRIQRQYPGGRREWVVTNGGANDLNGLCGCGACNQVMDRLVTSDGSGGAWPDHVGALLEQGAEQVLIVGYYGPSRAGPGGFAACTDDLIELDRRLARQAARDDQVHFVSPRRAMGGSPQNYAPDRTHPSPRGSSAIASVIARAIAGR